MSRQPRAYPPRRSERHRRRRAGDGGALRRHRGRRRRRRADGSEAPGALGRHSALRAVRAAAAGARARHREPDRRSLSRSRPGSAGWRWCWPFWRVLAFLAIIGREVAGIWREQKIEQPARGGRRCAGRQGPQGRQEHRVRISSASTAAGPRRRRAAPASRA